MIEIITNKLEKNLSSSNGHDLRIIKLLNSDHCRLVKPYQAICEHSTVLDIPGLGLRNYIKICISGKKVFRNIFLQDSFYRFQLSKLKFLVRSRQWRKISFKDFINLIRAGIREFFFYFVARNLGFVSFDDAMNFKNVVIVVNGVDSVLINAEPHYTDKAEFVFWGNLNYIPNLESILHLLKQNWSIISSSIENCSLELYGVTSKSSRDAISEVINEYNFDNVFIKGPFDNLIDTVRGKIFLNCIQFGSGVKNKTLEALALCIPQICTKEALSGIYSRENILCFENFILDPQVFLNELLEQKITKPKLITWDECCDIYKKNMVRN